MMAGMLDRDCTGIEPGFGAGFADGFQWMGKLQYQCDLFQTLEQKEGWVMTQEPFQQLDLKEGCVYSPGLDEM